jgi:hypothetical protein
MCALKATAIDSYKMAGPVRMFPERATKVGETGLCDGKNTLSVSPMNRIGFF